MPDKAFDLAIVDPPYGIGFDGDSTLGNNSSPRWPNPQKSTRYALKTWDREKPSPEYFATLLRVSWRAIVWGGNYFADVLPASGGSVVWTKGTADGMSLSDAEIAWTNAANNIKVCSFLWSGFRKCETTDRIHPTQKPVALYRWLLTNYAKPGDTILDTHLGSGSSRIAAYDLGFDFVGYELDTDYFNAQEERFARHIAQPKLFAPTPTLEPQEALF